MVTSDTTSATQNDATSNKTQRQILIEELKRLKKVFASKEEEKITNVFKFPLAGTSMGIYINDSAYIAQLKNNGGKTTKTMFIRYFSQIWMSLQLEELNQLFKSIKLDNLQSRDTLETEVYLKTEPCYKFYGIEVQGNVITLTTGQRVNDNFKSSKTSENDIPENSSEFCESVIWWVFSFDGHKIHFVKQHGAG